MSTTRGAQRLKVGIIGAGEVAQVIHLPVLQLLSHLYTTTAICDISEKTTKHCADKYQIPFSTTSPAEVYNHKDVDVVFILTSDEQHESLAIGSLKAGKHIMIEKPLTLSIPSVKRIVQAQEASGKVVFVGYMRRYAPSFTQAFKREVASIPRILYARSRDFPGPNPGFVAQSGTFPVKHDDVSAAASKERTEKIDELVKEALRGDVTDEGVTYCRFLGTLGSHDISLMREALGSPESIAGVSVNDPVYSAIFNYRNKSGQPFSATYESGWDDVPDFDAHLAIYGQNKRVTIKYDTPFVKGLAIKVIVQEKNEHGETQSREIVSSYEDAYTVELQELYDCVVNGKAVKTSVRDALNDLEIYDKMYQHWRTAQATSLK